LSAANLKQVAKSVVRSLLPLFLRKRIAIWINGQSWINADTRGWWTVELIRDLAENDINRYHKFLWANHLAYAVTYEVEQRFGHDNINESRKMLFSDLNFCLAGAGVQPGRDIMSVFDVGCSAGYHLRYLETDIFTSASSLEGIDIDEYAVRTGTNYLKQLESKILLTWTDMEKLSSVLGNRMFDVIICAGCLMYLCEEAAAGVVDEMLRHTGKLLVLTGLAHPEIDNSQLTHSVTREHDRSFIHNIDAMVEKAGGEIRFRRWEGERIVDGNTIYFVFASKAREQV